MLPQQPCWLAGRRGAVLFALAAPAAARPLLSRRWSGRARTSSTPDMFGDCGAAPINARSTRQVSALAERRNTTATGYSTVTLTSLELLEQPDAVRAAVEGARARTDWARGLPRISALYVQTRSSSDNCFTSFNSLRPTLKV